MQNSIGRGQRNADRTNQSAEYNLRNDQRISDANVGIRNQAADTNRTAPQRAFQNEMSKAGGVSNGLTGQAQGAAQDSQRTSNMWGGLASGVSQMGAAYMQGSQADEANALKEKELALKYPQG